MKQGWVDDGGYAISIDDLDEGERTLLQEHLDGEVDMETEAGFNLGHYIGWRDYEAWQDDERARPSFEE